MADTFPVDPAKAASSALPCGDNAALGDLTGKINEIKDKLNEGLSALADLEAKATEALSKLTSLKAEIPGLDSLQADLAAALAAAQNDAASAFAAFREKWGEALPEAEIQGYIDTITALLSDPTSLLTFDACKAFPNKQIDPATGKVSTKAQAAAIPNAAPTTFTETPSATYEPVITRTYESKITDEMKANTAARKKAGEDIEAYFKPKYKALALKIKEAKKDDNFGTIATKARESGKKYHQLKDEGALTDGEVKWVELRDSLIAEREFLKARDYILTRQVFAYNLYLSGEMPAKTYEEEANHPEGYLQGGKKDADGNQKIPAEDIAKFREIEADLKATEAGAKGWYAYNQNS
jgi:hypothetical protein